MIGKKAVGYLLETANPVASDHMSPTSPTANSMLERIVAQPATLPPRPLRHGIVRAIPLRVAAIVAAIAVALLGIQLISTNGTALAATPPLLVTKMSPTASGARGALLDIADRVQTLPDDTGPGSIAQVSTQTWSLFTRVDGQQVTSEVVPQATVTRTAGDGTVSVTTRYRYNGENHQESYTSKHSLNYRLHTLSPVTDTLAKQLAVGHPAENGTAGTFDAIVEAYRQMPIEPEVRASIFRLLANSEGIQTVGTLIDRFGRTGLGVTVDSDFSGLPTRYMLIVDKQDGRLLGYEEMLTSNAGKLNVRTPAIVHYIAFKSAAYVD